MNRVIQETSLTRLVFIIITITITSIITIITSILVL